MEDLKKQDLIDVASASKVNTSFLANAPQFPLVVEPAQTGLDLQQWIDNNVQQFERDLLQYGAILLRGFAVDTVEKFQALMAAFPTEKLEYKFRSSPRYALADNVYVSTTYPNDQSIAMHSESSYAPNHPARIVFCCIISAEEQGETPIADNRMIYNGLSEELKAKFTEKGVMYRRNLNPMMGLNWREVFQTEDKQEVEANCKESGINFTWESDEDLILDWTKKGIWQHPMTNETVWFNHALFFNKHMLLEEILDLVDSDDELPNNTYFGDGTEISAAEIDEIKQAYKNATIEFPWQKGDVLFLDNMLISHGRNPYKGDRKIIVSMS